MAPKRIQVKSQPARVAPIPQIVTSLRDRDTLVDRLLAFRDRVYASPTFHYWAARIPLVHLVARSRSQALFDLTAGFVYTQTLTACIRLDLFAILSRSPLTPLQISVACGLPLDGTERLLEAATALRLVASRSGGRFGLGALGSPILAQPSMVRMVEHNALLYSDLVDPISLLSRSRGVNSAVGHFFPYAETSDPESLSARTVAAYSRLMAQTVAPIAKEVLDSGILEGRSCLLDVGGGEGAFLNEVAVRYQQLRLRLFDLPAVVELATARIEEASNGHRFERYSGDFHQDALPEGADVISLVRILLDHDDARVLSLLLRARAALPRTGRLIIAEPMTDVAGAERAGRVYFSFYLKAMGRGRCRSTREIISLVRQAGFRRSRLLTTNYPVFASILVAEP